MTREEFESKWFNKHITCLGNYYKLAKNEPGFVTAALYNHYDGETIFSVWFEKLNMITFHIGNDELEELMSDFIIVEGKENDPL